MRRISAAAAGLALASLAACQQAPKPLSSADEAAIRATRATFESAAGSGSADSMAALYTADAVVLPPNMARASGTAAIKELFTGMMTAGRPTLRLTMDEVAGRQDMAYVVGTYHLSWTPATADAAAPPADSGKYVEVLMRQADGGWKTVADMWNSDAPPPMPTPAPAPARRR